MIIMDIIVISANEMYSPFNKQCIPVTAISGLPVKAIF